MNARKLSTTFCLTASLALFAMSATAQADSTTLDPIQVRGTLIVDCDAPRVPGFIEIGRIFDVANAGAAYALRGRVQALVSRTCHRDAQSVMITRAPASPSQPVNLLAKVY